ncbi:hypothetical protein SAMN06297229_0172 [Pseudidiomarina planktonica]|uniref:Uncharacterized protein n=1 Tax=Pseudidiomarina planktonica TaxID=1323738 RepID=A0A1Y6ED07_9GAMM|nr:DUF6689 family protein [Pseudidiomarina planktonica]RUO66328.1 hypothetical protein CWI77_07870 [Pseudidiomarina planktonica]SMQ58800.1 hypothetical protein SAMN06297229_0172 [Pseudidiomarina planktonica]
MTLLRLIFLTALLLPASAKALSVDVNFNQAANSVNAEIDLSSTVSLDFSVGFEKAVGLTPQNFSIDAELVSLTDPRVVNRLPTSLLTSLPAAFPVLISVEPDPTKGFAFSGAATIELYTKSLHYTQGTPLRLFHAHGDETFQDITLMTGSGSYRVRGSTGQFSDFLILVDLRDNLDVISDKVSQLENFTNAVRQQLSFDAETQLVDLVQELSSALDQGQHPQAMTALNELIHVLESDNGTLYPDVWRSSDDVINVRGRLLSLTQTLRYSLRIN